MNSTGHLTPEDAASFVRPDGGLPASARIAISDHAATCDVCRALLAEAYVGQGQKGTTPELARVFVGLIEAGRQEENAAPENWAGGEEFAGAMPSLTPVERTERQRFEQQMSRFNVEVFAPGGTLASAGRPAVATTRAVERAAESGWWQKLFSWQGLTLAGAMAAVVALAVVIALPGRAPRPVSGPVAVTNETGKAELVDGPVQVSVDGTLAGLAAIPVDLREAVLETIRRGAAPGALLGKLTRGGGSEAATKPAVAGDDPTVSVPVSPVSTSVETEQPVFRWKAGATPGTVEIVVRPSAGGEEIRSLPLPAGTVEWTPPTPLTRGALYRWQIVAVSPEGQETGTAGSAAKPGAVFKVLSADAHERLEALRSGASGRSHLTLGVAYAREGLKEESAREFRTLKESNAQSVLAKRLVDSVEGRGG